MGCRRASEEWNEEAGDANGRRLLPFELEKLGIEFSTREKRQENRTGGA